MHETDQLRVACPTCGKRLRVKTSQQGKTLKCPSCSSPVQVPLQSCSDDSGAAGSKQQTSIPVSPRKMLRAQGVSWLVLACGIGGLVLSGLALFLWFGAKTQVSDLEAKVADANKRSSSLENALKKLGDATDGSLGNHLTINQKALEASEKGVAAVQEMQKHLVLLEKQTAESGKQSHSLKKQLELAQANLKAFEEMKSEFALVDKRYQEAKTEIDRLKKKPSSLSTPPAEVAGKKDLQKSKSKHWEVTIATASAVYPDFNNSKTEGVFTNIPFLPAKSGKADFIAIQVSTKMIKETQVGTSLPKIKINGKEATIEYFGSPTNKEKKLIGTSTQGVLSIFPRTTLGQVEDSVFFVPSPDPKNAAPKLSISITGLFDLPEIGIR